MLDHLVYIRSEYRARFTRFNHRARELPRAREKRGTSVYYARLVVVGQLHRLLRDALITLVFQGVQTRGWMRANHRGCV